MKRTMLRKKSPKMKLIDSCESLLRKILILERGDRCEICLTQHPYKLGLFHILNKKDFPRLRLHADNILLAGWACCHKRFHNDPYFARDVVWPRIAEILGQNWETILKVLNSTLPKLSMFELNLKKKVFEMELEKYKPPF